MFTALVRALPTTLRRHRLVLVPGLLHWQHPRFFGYFPANSSGPAVLADLLCAGLGVQGMLWVTSPACTELEQRVLDWLAEALGLPERFRFAGPGGGAIQDTASSSVILAVLAAMHRASAGQVRREGVAAHRYVLYATAETHSSVTKAALVTGLGEQAVRRVATRLNRCTHRYTVTWSICTPRSTSSSSTLRYESP